MAQNRWDDKTEHLLTNNMFVQLKKKLTEKLGVIFLKENTVSSNRIGVEKH